MEPPLPPPASYREDARSALLCLGLSTTGLQTVGRAFPEAIKLQSTSTPETVAAACAAVGPAVLLIDEGKLPERLAQGRPPLLSLSPTASVLVLCREEREALLEQALAAGCAGVLREDVSEVVLRRAVRAVQDGELWFPRRLLSQATRRAVSAPSPQRLTARERQILQLLGRDQKNQAIADQLFISRETVRWHLRALYAKLGVTSRDQAQRYARETKSARPLQ